MQCPVCDVTLAMSNREGVEIDYCPKCRGVWLDRGELDKIIERSVGSFGKYRGDDDDDDDDDDHEHHGYYGHKKRRSWTDMFDFG